MSLAPASPRLPSPPPAAEIQIGPKSPAGGPAAIPHTTHQEQTMLDASSRRRIHPGTKSEDMAAGPPLIPLHELDSAFQLQEHLAALHYYHTASNTKALTRSTALQLAQPPAGIDRTLWLYELCRFLISQCNSLIVGFLFDTPPCSANTCPEMRASEWQFLCAVHEQPKSCCAIDYCCHTLDWAANVVTDQKIFPSRFVVLSDNHSKNIGVKNLVNVFRRLHRIFAHAWFQHRGVFWSVEGQTGLYAFFKSVCDLYDLLPAENYKLPPEAEGLETPSVEQEPEKPPPQILKPPSQQRGQPPEEDSLHPIRTNTRRHIRSSPSTGSAVTTVMEAEEEEGDGITRKMKEMHIAPPPTVNEDAEVADVPVIVEQAPVVQSKPRPKHKEPKPKPEPEPQPEPPALEQEDTVAEESDADQTIVDVESTETPTQGSNPVIEESPAPSQEPPEISDEAKEVPEKEESETHVEPAAQEAEPTSPFSAEPVVPAEEETPAPTKEDAPEPGSADASSKVEDTSDESVPSESVTLPEETPDEEDKAT